MLSASAHRFVFPTHWKIADLSCLSYLQLIIWISFIDVLFHGYAVEDSFQLLWIQCFIHSWFWCVSSLGSSEYMVFIWWAFIGVLNNGCELRWPPGLLLISRAFGMEIVFWNMDEWLLFWRIAILQVHIGRIEFIFNLDYSRADIRAVIKCVFFYRCATFLEQLEIDSIISLKLVEFGCGLIGCCHSWHTLWVS